MNFYPLRFSFHEPSLSDEPVHIATWLFLPPGVPRALIICLPGGSYTKAYYHLQVPDYGSDDYSAAAYFAQQGFIVVCLDHLGTGESTRPPNGKLLSAEMVARINDAVVNEVQAQLQKGSLLPELPALPPLPVVGVGHSLGAYLLLFQQERFHSYDAIAPLGWSNGALFGGGMDPRMAQRIGLPEDTPSSFFEFLSRSFEENAAGYLTIDRYRVRPVFYLDDVPEEVIDADIKQQTHMPSGLVMSMSDPEILQQEVEKITVPVFLGNGSVDVSRKFLGETSAYMRCQDITCFELQQSGHCHNFASTRRQLWQRLSSFALEISTVSVS